MLTEKKKWHDFGTGMGINITTEAIIMEREAWRMNCMQICVNLRTNLKIYIFWKEVFSCPVTASLPF